MKKNMSGTDAVVRVVIAALIGVLYFSNVISGTLAIILLAVGAIFLITGFINFCPIYAGLGIRTAKSKS